MIPAQLTTLIGREGELEALTEALAGTRLLTLTGAGGVGKTRLALEAAASVSGDAWWIALASRDDVPSAIVRALDVRALPGVGELDAVVAFLHERRALLVLDNCEHLADDVARVVSALLARLPAADGARDEPRPARDSRRDALGGPAAVGRGRVAALPRPRRAHRPRAGAATTSAR